MKTSLILRVFMLVILGGVLGLTAPAFGDAAPVSADLLNQAYDLVHQAWNPGGDPPSDAQRTELLTKALGLIKDAPDHHLKGTRVQASRDIKAALDMLKAGDPDHKAGDLIHTAAEELRDAISLSQ
jgi:hypothetical protein